MQHSIHIDESKLTRPERRRLKRNIESGEQQQLERIGFIFARAMESFRIEARKEFDPKVVEKFIYMAFAPEQPKETLLEKIKIICPTHGPFEQEANSHLKGSGCRKCQISKGEEAVMNFLNFNNIHFLTQYSFEKCVNENKLLFDFYLPKQNICIEFDGIQHEKAISFFGGEEGLRKTKKRDQIKNLFCIESNIKLIRIKKIENIEKELLPLLK